MRQTRFVSTAEADVAADGGQGDGCGSGDEGGGGGGGGEAANLLHRGPLVFELR